MHDRTKRIDQVESLRKDLRADFRPFRQQSVAQVRPLEVLVPAIGDLHDDLQAKSKFHGFHGGDVFGEELVDFGDEGWVGDVGVLRIDFSGVWTCWVGGCGYDSLVFRVDEADYAVHEVAEAEKRESVPQINADAFTPSHLFSKTLLFAAI